LASALSLSQAAMLPSSTLISSPSFAWSACAFMMSAFSCSIAAAPLAMAACFWSMVSLQNCEKVAKATCSSCFSCFPFATISCIMDTTF
jgi:hypothetical protein